MDMFILGDARCLISQVTNITLQIIYLLLIGFDTLNFVFILIVCHNPIFAKGSTARSRDPLATKIDVFVKTNSVGSV